MTVPALSTLARRVLDEAALAPGSVVVVACSGGVDSQVLLDVLAHVCGRDAARGVRLEAHGIDHGLRADAADELDLANALALARGVPFHRTHLAVAPGPNLQARARNARWTALRAYAARVRQRLVGGQRALIATGHQRDDRAETVLIRLLRGAPLGALAVLPSHDDDRIRPLIAASRAAILAHARRRGIAFASDPSNVDPRYLRVRVRHEVLPLLASLDPAIVDHLDALASAVAHAIARSPEVAVSSDDPKGAHDRAHHERGSYAARDVTAALAALRTSKDSDARVWLADGAIARWDDKCARILVESAPEASPHPDGRAPARRKSRKE